MKKGLNGFSLIEVIIASSILTMSVFGIYKLIGENNKVINNSSNYINSINLFPIIEECIEYIGFDALNNGAGWSESINFGNTGSLNECNTGTTYSVIINNIEYLPEIKILELGTNFIDWELSIESDYTKTLTGLYKQFKK